MFINESLIRDIRSYVFSKTGKNYFGRIKSTDKDIMVSCPYHNNGQERNPSCGIMKVTTEKGYEGMLHCFACHKVTDLLTAVKDMLGSSYNEDEVEARFGLSTALARENAIRQISGPSIQFEVPDMTNVYIQEKELRLYRTYHNYLAQRKITENTAKKYDIGYDQYNSHITFPIRDKYKNCLAVGRRSIIGKEYYYPESFIKPLYGVYELPRFLNHLWVVEGPFNLWSLYEYGKTGVALLGTGTLPQMQQLLTIECDDYVLALDGDEAGHRGIDKIGNFLQNAHKKVFVMCVPDGYDINDMTYEQFLSVEVIPFNEWKYWYYNQ